MQCRHNREQLTIENKMLTQKHLDTLGSSITTTREEQTSQREHYARPIFDKVHQVVEHCWVVGGWGQWVSNLLPDLRVQGCK